MLEFQRFFTFVVVISDPGDFGVISIYALICRGLVD